MLAICTLLLLISCPNLADAAQHVSAVTPDLIQGVPRLLLYCPNSDCLTRNSAVESLARVYPFLLFTTNSQGLAQAGQVPQLYSIGAGLVRRNEAELGRYASLEVLPYSYQFSEEMMVALQNRANSPRLVLAVINASLPQQIEFYRMLLEVSPRTNIGYVDVDRQFDFAFSLEVYKRHCPTLIAYDPWTGDLRLSYVKFGWNTTEDRAKAPELVESLNSGKVQSIRLGWMNSYTKLLNVNYVYNNFHMMFNYIVGGISGVLIILLLLCEKRLIRLMQRRPHPPPAPAANMKKAN